MSLVNNELKQVEWVDSTIYVIKFEFGQIKFCERFRVNYSSGH